MMGLDRATGRNFSKWQSMSSPFRGHFSPRVTSTNHNTCIAVSSSLLAGRRMIGSLLLTEQCALSQPALYSVRQQRRALLGSAGITNSFVVRRLQQQHLVGDDRPVPRGAAMLNSILGERWLLRPAHAYANSSDRRVAKWGSLHSRPSTLYRLASVSRSRAQTTSPHVLLPQRTCTRFGAAISLLSLLSRPRTVSVYHRSHCPVPLLSHFS